MSTVRSVCILCGWSEPADSGLLCRGCRQKLQDEQRFAQDVFAMRDEAVAEELRAAGGDPDAIGARGAKLAAELMSKRRKAGTP